MSARVDIGRLSRAQIPAESLPVKGCTVSPTEVGCTAKIDGEISHLFQRQVKEDFFQ